jgi:hypothetical protein
MPDDLHLDDIIPTEADLCHPWTEAPAAECPVGGQEVLPDDAEIARLAALNRIDYSRQRKVAANKMGVQMSVCG